MNSETHTIATPVRTPSPARRFRLAGLVVVAALGVAACNSEPSARRVATDIIKTLAEPGAERDCMLEKLKGYDDNQLEEITASAADPGPGTAIDLFEADLALCR